MADIRMRLKHWWQDKSVPAPGRDVQVSQDVLHLFRLRREHRLLRLRFAGIAQDFQSLLLEVDLKHNRLLLDDPFPLLAESELFGGRRLDVASIEGAASTRFETRVLGMSHVGDLKALSVAMPGVVTAAQRRNRFRLTVREHMPVQAVLRLEALGNLAAQVQDLSSAGVRLLVPSLAEQPPLESAPLFLRLGDERGMLCTLRVCSLQHTLNKESTLIGGELLGLNPPQVQLIERFIARTQRLQRQRDMALEG